jgi:hypothetical protein
MTRKPEGSERVRITELRNTVTLLNTPHSSAIVRVDARPLKEIRLGPLEVRQFTIVHTINYNLRQRLVER